MSSRRLLVMVFLLSIPLRRMPIKKGGDIIRVPEEILPHLRINGRSQTGAVMAFVHVPANIGLGGCPSSDRP